MALFGPHRFVECPFAQKRSFSRGQLLTDTVEKSFGGNKRDFPKLLMRFRRGDVMDHFTSQKNDHGPSYRRY
jgi:hypothetical protein